MVTEVICHNVKLEKLSEAGKVGLMASPYSLVAVVLCVDKAARVLMAQESRADCRGLYYVPAATAGVGEDLLAVAQRVTLAKTGLKVQISGLVGVEHHHPRGQYTGQIRVYFGACVTAGELKSHSDDNSMRGVWVKAERVRELKLRLDDFVPWLQDLVSGVLIPASARCWKTFGQPLP